MSIVAIRERGHRQTVASQAQSSDGPSAFDHLPIEGRPVVRLRGDGMGPGLGFLGHLGCWARSQALQIQPTTSEWPGPQNQVPDTVSLTLACIVVPGTTQKDLERELRAVLGEGDYEF